MLVIEGTLRVGRLNITDAGQTRAGRVTWPVAVSYILEVRAHRHSSFSGVYVKVRFSPFLFLLMMDPLLKQLQSASLGLSIHNTYDGGYLHADDIRTLACSYFSMEAQIPIVLQFASDNFLTLNESKCDVVVISASTPKHSATASSHVVCHSFPNQDEAKCLGYIWRRNLSAARMINERIHKARRAFFQFGSISAFQGNLNPISSSSIIECCVYPILLYIWCGKLDFV